MGDIHDLMKLTGQGRQAVTNAIARGDLPGYRCGPGGKIWVPDEALELLKTGHWRPASQDTEEHRPTPFVRTVRFTHES